MGATIMGHAMPATISSSVEDGMSRRAGPCPRTLPTALGEPDRGVFDPTAVHAFALKAVRREATQTQTLAKVRSVEANEVGNMK